MFEYVQKRKTIAKQKKKNNVKKIKTNQIDFYNVQINVIKKKKIFVCFVIVNAYVLLNVFRIVDYHYYIDFDAKRFVNENLIVFINFIKFVRFIIVFDFNEKNIVIQQNNF